MKPFALLMAAIMAGAWLLPAVPGLARSAAIPKDVDGFTEAVAAQFAKALPGQKISVTHTLLLEVGSGTHANQVRLDNIWSFCERDRRHCSRTVRDFVAGMSGTILESGMNVTRDMIRVIVRGPGYIDDMRKVAANKPDAAGIVRPVAGELWLICVVDKPHGIETLDQKELKELGLSEDQAIAVGLRNLAAALKPLEQDTHILPKVGLKFAAGDFYESSRMLLHDSWRDMAKQMHGHLLVAVPSRDVIIYGDGSGNGDRIALASFARSIVQQAPKPLSDALFEWTETGWKAVKPE